MVQPAPRMTRAPEKNRAVVERSVRVDGVVER